MMVQTFTKADLTMDRICAGLTLATNGGAENAGVENAGVENVGVDSSAGVENAGVDSRGGKCSRPV